MGDIRPMPMRPRGTMVGLLASLAMLVALVGSGLADQGLAHARDGSTPAATPAASPASGGQCADADAWWAGTSQRLDTGFGIYRANAAAWAVGHPGPDDTAWARSQVEALQRDQASAVVAVPPAGMDLQREVLAFYAAVLDLIDLVGVGFDGDPALAQSAHAARLKAIENIAPLLIASPGRDAFLAACHPEGDTKSG